MLDYGRGICNSFEAASQREWLVTNGIGGFAAGTIAGTLTRHYHGLLLAALQPPLGRTLTLVRLDETVIYSERLYRLFTNHWEDGAVEPRGFDLLDRFRLEGTTPVWTYAIADALLEKRIWMEPGANTTCIEYRLVRASQSVNITLKTIVNYRDYHGSSRMDNRQMQVDPVPGGVQVIAGEGAVPLRVLLTGARFTPQHTWLNGYYKAIEAERGLDCVEDHLWVGEFELTLFPGHAVTVIATTETQGDFGGEDPYLLRQQYERQLLRRVRSTGALILHNQMVLERLLLAADQFIVRRGEGHTVIAGYPWFSDWGRDTMIALPGLTLSTGRPEIAESVLRTFAKYISEGMLPNRFPDEGETPEYNTVDATLWYFEAVRACYAATGNQQLLIDLYPLLAEIIDWHRRGTRYSIQMDPEDGLLFAGEAGVQLTWMDVKIGDRVITPRTGKAVEINALWYNALRCMVDFTLRLGYTASNYLQMADRVKTSFQRFWNGAYCYDVLDGPAGHDATLRPNQLFAASLHHSPLTTEQQRMVVDVCARYLVTPHGLRSLSSDDEAYIGVYSGDRVQRDEAYHQGTVWGWLIGPFVQAHLRAYGDKAAARSYLEPLIRHLDDYGIGSIAEIFDGDPPFKPRGCFAQAWSVAEVLRVWVMTS